jgi:hypothetical protein
MAEDIVAAGVRAVVASAYEIGAHGFPPRGAID